MDEEKAEWRKQREKAEWWKELEWKLDRCNHLMEFMRTCLALCTLVLQVIILLKLFNVI